MSASNAAPKISDSAGSESVAALDGRKSLGVIEMMERSSSQQAAGTTAMLEPRPPLSVESVGNFPSPGSSLGPYFCLGRLGKGTFCSIHKCIDLGYYTNPTKRSRFAAAKVELSNFANSGVLEGEAMMLHHLDQVLPPDTVPNYFGHYTSQNVSAILMEFLPKEDMHQLREINGNRRMTLEDAVYLTQVLLTLLQRMHEAGVVHRDVKPSNSVRRDGREFLMVDFGLSKSLLVPKDHHSLASSPEEQHVWNETHCLRQEREKAEFRGTSMYASLRVHQLCDYTFRDDMWSLLYVFCDLASGGLPWMSYAATRDREACQRLKQTIHGEGEGPDQTEEMLKGEHYHVGMFRRKTAEASGTPPEQLPPVPEPLAISRDVAKVDSLRRAFEHLKSLKFSDKPDYELLRQCLAGFLQGPLPREKEDVPRVKWEDQKTRGFSPTRDGTTSSKSKRRKRALDGMVPTWTIQTEHVDPLDASNDEDSDKLWEEAESQLVDDRSLEGHAADMARLPLEFQFRMAQMNFHRKHVPNTPPEVALRDWMKASIPLVFGQWDSAKYERGNHRTNTDGHRRELYLKLVGQCLKCAKAFQDFSDPACYYNENDQPRKISSPSQRMGTKVAVSRVLLGLKAAHARENKKRSAPPPALSFSQGTL